MEIMDKEKTSTPIYIACVTFASVAFAFLLAPQLLSAQGQATETFFEAAVREASEGGQQQQQPSAVQGQATETFFEAAVREASEGGQQPSPVEEQPSPVEEQPSPVEEQPSPVEEQPSPVEEQPSPVEEQEETEPTNPFEQLGEAISRLFGGGN
jgi:outer membrane biosynthesis protein TonB